jgi:hypothetical protein
MLQHANKNEICLVWVEIILYHKFRIFVDSRGLGVCILMRVVHNMISLPAYARIRDECGVQAQKSMPHTLHMRVNAIRLRVIKRTQCNLPLPRITQSEKYVSLFVPEDYQK